MGRILWAGLATLSMPALSACSMLERYQVYESKESSPVAVTELAEVSVQFKRIPRLLALGPMGLPVVPVAGDPTAVTEFQTIVTLSLEAPASFSLNSLPCLQAGPDTVCPHLVEVEQWMNLPATSEYAAFWVNRFSLELPIAHQPRLTDEYLFKMRLAGSYKNDRNEFPEFPSPRDAQWTRGYVSLTFSYKCPAECPKNVSFTMDDLARVNDQASGGGVRQFDRTAHTKYHFGFALQDG